MQVLCRLTGLWLMLVGLLWFESLQVMCFQIVGSVRLEGLMLALVMALQV